MTGFIEFKKVGFIGLGAMGKPMVSQLASKLPAEAKIHVFDVVEEAMDDICLKFPHRVCKCSSSKEVAQQAVRCISLVQLYRLTVI